MKPIGTRAVVAMASLMMLCLGVSAFGTSSIGMPYDYKFEPVEIPKEAGPVTFVLEVAMTQHCRNCESITITVETIGGVEYHGPESVTIQAEMGDTYSETMEFSLRPNDTGRINVFLYSKDPNHDNEFGDVIRCSFVTTGDTVEYFEGFPYPKPEPPPKTKAQRRAESRTPEKLAKIHGVRVHLVDSLQREIYKSIVGPLPEFHRGRFYFVETTWGNMLQLADSGINWTYIPPGEDPFPPKSPPPQRPIVLLTPYPERKNHRSHRVRWVAQRVTPASRLKT